jgi:uncharacterized protein YraI
MFKHFIAAAAAAVTIMASVAVADAASARLTGNVNLRAGPGTQYYKVTSLPAGAPVEVFGCLPQYTWCDIGYGGLRGWVSARYLSVFYAGPTFRPLRPTITLPFLSFDFGYWDRHYRDRPWYNRRPDWGHRPPPNWGPRPGDHRPPPNWGPRPGDHRPPPNWGPRPGDHRPPPNVGPRPGRERLDLRNAPRLPCNPDPRFSCAK